MPRHPTRGYRGNSYKKNNTTVVTTTYYEVAYWPRDKVHLRALIYSMAIVMVLGLLPSHTGAHGIPTTGTSTTGITHTGILTITPTTTTVTTTATTGTTTTTTAT
ncbi:MAG: hypothetical protein MZV63_32250 [Marinilabiliales bacterium]|nr:hypothetical protein [Marinilabiliales bacterium]